MSDISSMNGLNSSYTNNYVSQTGNNLESSLNNADLSKATDDELMDVCKDFEQYFVEQVLKSMEKMASIDGDSESTSGLFSTMAGISGGEQDSGMSTLGSYFGDQYTSTLAEALTNTDNGQGLGIAQTLYQQMKRNYAASEISSTDTPKGTTESIG